ncbi:MAG TPA: hypothetical protein PKC59_13445 [Burkholderiaceae bacterium]|nr:hypothetical protein [Burkholderiaceae bacterium]HMX11184.1 hypothetical protein [Burkholderiaceae bacterium]HMZ02473.1 hypothetical protein [Burkholderiaceae bacterium]HNB44788.1 hypothetical protein [Burkholderiaceae bacterium]HNG80613.1 hypothetical protein [Burkholderiaceae bacterium]
MTTSRPLRLPRLRIHPLLLAAVLCAAAALPTAAAANDFGLDLVIGRANQRDGDTLLAVGGNVSYLVDGWWLHPEVGYEQKLFPVFSGEDRETTAGLRSEWPLGPRGRFFVGGGYANLRMHWGSNVEQSDGWYAHAGAMWTVGRGGFSMGVAAKMTRAPDYHPWGVTTRAGGERIGLLLSWRI